MAYRNLWYNAIIINTHTDNNGFLIGHNINTVVRGIVPHTVWAWRISVGVIAHTIERFKNCTIAVAL